MAVYDNNNKEVDFETFCETCEHNKTLEAESPCYECLEEPVRRGTHRPAMWKEKKK